MPLIYATDGTHLLGWDPLGGFSTIATFAERVDDIAFGPDGRLWGVRDTTLLQIDPLTGQVLSRLAVSTSWSLTGLGLSPDDRTFVTISDGVGVFEVNRTTGRVPNFDRNLNNYPIDGIISAYGDLIVFNNRLWSLSLIDDTRGTPVTRTPSLLGFNLATGALEHYFELNDLLPPGFSGRGFDGLAIGQDGHLYLTGAGRNGVGSAVFRVDLSPYDRGDRTLDTRLVLVSESATQAMVTGAAGALDSSRVWSIGGRGDDALAPWSTVAPARLHGHGGNDSLTAGTGDDDLYGGAGNDSLAGLDGTDDLFGEDGDDSLAGGAGNDAMQGGLGNDMLAGGEGSDILQDEGVGADSILGGAGNDVILAADGNDTALGESGADQVQGEGGADSLDGGSENDTLTGGSGADTLLGGTGDDQIAGDQEADSILGGSGNDRGFGGAGNDTLRGEAGIDALRGDAGNDRLVGGAGADTLTGGSGADTFRFESLADYFIAPTPFGPPVLNRFTPDVIADFSALQADQIDLGALFDSFGAAAGALSAAQLRAQGWLRVTQSGPDALVQVDGNGAAGGASFLTVAIVQNSQAAALTDLAFLV